MSAFGEFEALGKLLQDPNAEEPLPGKGGPPGMSPGSFGGPVELDDAVIPKPKRRGVQDIWEEEEVEEDHGLVNDPSDKRLRPEYDILYKQEVSSTDCYLGIDFEKDPGTHCCNEVVVKITLPGETLKALDLDVQKSRLTVQSVKHVLRLPLPYPCDPDNGSAKFDPKSEVLSVTLPIIRPDV